MKWLLENIEFKVGQVWKVNCRDLAVTGVTGDIVYFDNGTYIRTDRDYHDLSLFMVRDAEEAVNAACSQNTNMGDVLAALPEMDMAGRIAAFIEMRGFARVALIAALERGAIHQGDDLVERWEELTGEVYAEDYCARE